MSPWGMWFEHLFPSIWHYFGRVEPLKWEVWLVKMGHWKWAFEGLVLSWLPDS